MKRVIFVDDEPAALQQLQTMLSGPQSSWDMTFVQSAALALEEMEKRPADILVTDLRMPGMDGVALLQVAKGLHPSTTRIVLSGFADRSSVLRSVGLAHQFISKPCDARELHGVIERAFAAQRLLSDPQLRETMATLDKLPASPELYLQLTRLLGKESTSASDVARVIEKDPSMSAKVLQLVNSAYFGVAQRISSIPQGVAYLGTELIRALVLSASAFSRADGLAPMPGYNMAHIQRVSLLTARLARHLPQDPREQEDAFAAGLMHNLGKVLLLSGMRGTTERISQTAAAQRLSCRAVEEQTLRVHHAHLGAYLLGTWGLPFAVVEAVASHHEPRSAQQVDVCVAVHVASALVGELVPEPGLTAAPDDSLDMALVESLGLQKQLTSWRQWTEDQIKKGAMAA